MEEAGGSCPKPTKRSIIARPGFGSSGHPMPLLSNHFKVSVNVTDVVFYQYSVSITAEDNRVVDEKRKIIDRLCQTYSCELAGKSFAYDGEKKGQMTVLRQLIMEKYQNRLTPTKITKRGRVAVATVVSEQGTLL
ncbi:hypothetical protein GH714_035091 [Hevea brasiliensis]|uniref:Protein argonaute N-terminal domain-containing protein n=1 Tax=Hevea brasiliensis TaxID=3981 RepID=A0A6A6KY59_HEVBR|nr:hypothetical protein GH714_035091 [Hevea brasiliensis]